MGMSIATRPTGGSPASGSRDERGTPIGTSRPPEELLPDGGNLAPGPVPAPDRVLARDARRLLESLRLQHQPRASGSILTAEMEAVRDQLRPIRSRRSLAASYGREAFHDRAAQTDRGSVHPTRIAYALRWLELGPDRS